MTERPSRSDPPGPLGSAPSPPGEGSAPATPQRVVVVGLGNVLTGDDALGPTVVRHMEAAFQPRPEVEIVDAGTPGMDLAALLADADAAIVVDTVMGDDPPGTVKCYDRKKLLSRPLQPRTNPHAPGLSETLLSLELLEMGPGPVLLVGVVPHAVEVGRALSPALEGAIPAVMDTVLDELRRLGLPLVRRPDSLPPDLWWQRSPALSRSPD